VHRAHQDPVFQCYEAKVEWLEKVGVVCLLHGTAKISLGKAELANFRKLSLKDRNFAERQKKDDFLMLKFCHSPPIPEKNAPAP
jgi:hypothetical protein